LKKTKIVATIGPASNGRLRIAALLAAGMDVARLNFSHGTHEEHNEVIEIIRDLTRHGQQAAILQDIAGPKIRIGEITEGSINLDKGQSLILTETKVMGTTARITVNLPGFSKFVSTGDIILVSDGLIELSVIKVNDGEVLCKTNNSGILSSRKGISLPGSTKGIKLLSEKDKRDIEFGIKAGVDFMAISFVRNAADIKEIKDILAAAESEIKIIAKIEKPEALANFDEILAAADGIMIARGDLGVEVAFERIPIIQKELIKKANIACKPVITATQMMVSMVDSLRPTRAEVTDVANAILDGTDALMLSEETAIGKNPELVVKTMSKITLEVEKSLKQNYAVNYIGVNEPHSVDLHVAANACRLADGTEAKALICFTMSGSTARKVVRFRPGIPVTALTQNIRTCRELCLSWGINPVLSESAENIMGILAETRQYLLRSGSLKKNEYFVMTAGIPFNQAGTTNLSGVFAV